jgi:hypothetical protein
MTIPSIPVRWVDYQTFYDYAQKMAAVPLDCGRCGLLVNGERVFWSWDGNPPQMAKTESVEEKV